MTSTSDGFDFARALTDAFVERRGRGSALSAADRHLVDGWESDGVPLPVVLEGIDAAFERRRDAPRSLKDCKRWVTAAIQRWRDAGAPVELGGEAELPVVADEAEAAPAPAPPPVDRLAARVVAVVRAAREAATDPAVRAGLGTVLDEVQGLVARGALDAHAVHALDDVALVAVHRAQRGGAVGGTWDQQVSAARAQVGDRVPPLVAAVLAGTNPGGPV